jgi:mono/diheme cytochrome c family protein
MSISRWTAMLVAALAVGWYLLGGQQQEGGIGPEGVVLDASDPKLTGDGKQIYAAYCASCHGSNLEGQPDWRTRNADGRLRAPPLDGTGNAWNQPDDRLFAITKYGAAAVTGRGEATDMPIFNGVLTDREIASALSYIKSKWPPEIREKQKALNEESRAGSGSPAE